MMRSFHDTLTIATDRGAALYPITEEINALIQRSGIQDGLCVALLQHTSASLLIQERDAIPDVERFFARLVPEDDDYILAGEGPDDMPAHIRSTLTQNDVSLPIENGILAFGGLQDLFLWEHRRHGQSRNLRVTLIGT